MGWVANFLDQAMKMQAKILYEFPTSQREKGYGNAAKLIIDGPEGGIFELWFSDKGIAPKPDNIPVRNTLYTTEDVLLDIITPDISLDNLVSLIEKEGTMDKAIDRLRPRLDPRTAFANRLIIMDGDNPDIDSEMWSQIWEKFIYGVAFPIVVQTMLRGKRLKRRAN